MNDLTNQNEGKAYPSAEDEAFDEIERRQKSAPPAGMRWPGDFDGPHHLRRDE